MTEPLYFLGIDGGGTSCRARLTAADGAVRGEGRGGGANVTLGAEPVHAQIMAAARAAFAMAGLGAADMAQTHACFGLAGTEATPHLEALRALPFPFRSMRIVNDSVIACAGAHGGDGAIVIVGTGTQGLLVQDGQMVRAGGWGFHISDDGSGAHMGRNAVRLAMLAHDGIVPHSPFTRAVLDECGPPAAIMEWALGAQPRDWAALAPLVQRFAAEGDGHALKVQAQAVEGLTLLIDHLVRSGAKKVALVGGLSDYYAPLVPERLQPLMVRPRGDPLDGALMLARQQGG